MSSSVLADPTYTAVKAIIAAIENKATSVCGFDPHLSFHNEPCSGTIKVILGALEIVGGWYLMMCIVEGLMVDGVQDFYNSLVQRSGLRHVIRVFNLFIL